MTRAGSGLPRSRRCLLLGLVSLAGAAARPRRRTRARSAPIARQDWSFCGFPRPVRPGAAAARLPDLSARLLGLPRPEAGALPQSRRAGRPASSPRPPSRRWPPPGPTRSRASSTTRATPSTGFPASPIPSSAPTRTTSRRARPRTARCRPTCRSSPRRARWKARALVHALALDAASTSRRGYQEGGADYV